MQQTDVVRQAQPAAGLMPASAIQQHDGMGTRRDVSADFGEVEVHRLGIGLGQDEAGADTTRGTGCAEDVGPIVALVAWRWRASALFSPDVGQAALLTDARFILPPELDRLATRLRGDGVGDQCGKVFLCASCAAASACG